MTSSIPITTVHFIINSHTTQPTKRITHSFQRSVKATCFWHLIATPKTVGGCRQMEGSEKRSKRSDERETLDTKRRKGEEINGGQTVTEDEVEEFFAILRRIQISLKYFEKNKSDRRKSTDRRWRPCFELEDFDDHNSVDGDDNSDHDGNKKDEDVAGDSGLDLNLAPAPLNNSG